MNIFIDIETLPTDRTDVRDLIASGVTHPGNISKAETIAKWNEESRPAAVAEAVARTGLDGTFGRVCVIGWAVNDEPVKSLYSEDDEAALLLAFSRALHIDPSDRHTTTLIGHNVASFDLRFLLQRFIVNGIRPPSVLHRSAQAKPWEADKVFDTMVQWNPDRERRTSLAKLCMALGIPSPKSEIDGSKVADYVAAGRIAEVAAYCEADVTAVREVYRRMTFQAHSAELKQAA